MPAATAMETLDKADILEAVIKARKSVRAFRPDPVPQESLDRIFEMASWAPSNCNTQPWTVHLASGATAKKLRDVLIKASRESGYSPDISYLMDVYPPEFKQRQIAHISAQQNAFGIDREDKEARAKLSAWNMGFWGAPHVAFLFMPEFGNEREAADIGMFAQNLMLACTALGLGSCPQTSLGLMAGDIKRELGVEGSLKLLFGVAIGYVDEENDAAQLVQQRRPVSEFVTIHD